VAEAKQGNAAENNPYDALVRLLRDKALYDSVFVPDGAVYELQTLIQSSAIAFDAYCPSCGADTTWRVAPSDLIPQNIGQLRQAGVAFKYFFEPFTKAMRYLDFKCSRNATHVLQFAVDADETGPQKGAIRLTKFGQLPSLADIASSEIDKYRQFISGVDLAELKRAVGLAAHGVGIGSFVYLRRVFERLVAEAADAAIDAGASQFTRDEFDRMRMEDKLQGVKDYVPAWMVQNRKLYAILSRGLHELSEDTCKQAFPAVKQATLALLEQHAEEAQKKKRATEAALELEKLQKTLDRDG
jgi:hypothetical protein